MKKILLIAAALVIATVGGCSKDSGSGSDYTAASTASTASDGSTVTIAASGESSNDEKPDQTDNSGSNGNDYYNDMPNETSTDGTTGKVSGTSKVQTVTEAKADTSVSDSGVTITKPTTITKDGTYIVTGKINGQIYVTAKDVTLILNGAEITNSGAPAILGEYGNGKQTLTITLKGTNIINGGTHGIQGKDKLVINGEGAVSVSAVKDGLHGGASLKIDGGNIDIIKSYEGMESPKITLNNGNVRIYADDDGMNAATDDKTVVPEIIINGGYLELYSNSDGIDSNGTITIAGGVVAVFN
ncbi:MAG: carbohydrate-binding domain-containing protein, partial [Oscillospiraceae bacterium]|nr:carbohydrate-binding domain-containing protein [Oscillospiraceae bacterium]